MTLIVERESRISSVLHERAARSRTPLSGTFELTPRCNMDCKMCYVHQDRKTGIVYPEPAPASKWLEIAEEAQNQGLLYLLLTGGEPFLYKDLPVLLEGLHRLGIVTSMNTNATLINETTIEWLKKFPPSKLNITVYGASDETYGKLCGNPKGFTQVTHAIDLLQEAGINLVINITLTPDNGKDLEKIMDFAHDRSIPTRITSYIFPAVRLANGKAGNNFRFSPEEAAYYSAKTDLLLAGKERYIQRVLEDKDIVMPETSPDECMGKLSDEEGDSMRCRAGKCSFWITWQGRMSLCGMLPFYSEGTVFDNGFSDAWKHVSKSSDEIKLPSQCRDCELKDQCRPCAAVVYTESGSFDQVPEYRCKMHHAFPSISWELATSLLNKSSDSERSK